MTAVDDRAVTVWIILAYLLLVGALLRPSKPARVAPACPAPYCAGDGWHILFAAPGFDPAGAIAAPENIGAGHPAAPE